MLIEPDFYDLSNIKSKDLILICSDGLYDMVEEKEIKKLLRKSANPTSDLINTALKNGGLDNITVMTITKE